MEKFRYYLLIVKWAVKHRKEKNCRQKWHRMLKEVAM